MIWPKDKARRIGKVRVECIDYDWPRLLLAVQRECAVLRCEYRVNDDSFHMDLYHPEFEPVQIGQKPPHYRAVLVSDKRGITRERFEKL